MAGKRARINYLVDVAILLLFVISTLSGLGLMRPQEERAAGVQVRIDQARAVIIEMHIISSFLLVAGVLVHLVLHWRWTLAMTRNMTSQ